MRRAAQAGLKAVPSEVFAAMSRSARKRLEAVAEAAQALPAKLAWEPRGLMASAALEHSLRQAVSARLAEALKDRLR